MPHGNLPSTDHSFNNSYQAISKFLYKINQKKIKIITTYFIYMHLCGKLLKFFSKWYVIWKAYVQQWTKTDNGKLNY